MSATTPIASGRVCRDCGEWYEKVPNEGVWIAVYELGGIEGDDVLMADTPPEVVAAYLSKPLPRGSAA